MGRRVSLSPRWRDIADRDLEGIGDTDACHPIYKEETVKRWAAVTIALYLVATVLLNIPAVGLGFGWENLPNAVTDYWALCLIFGFVLILCAIGLLAVPVAVSQTRPISRRKLYVPVLTGAFLFSLMSWGLIASLFVAAKGDHGLDLISLGVKGDSGVFVLAGEILLAWIVWGGFFFWYYRANEPRGLIKSLGRWLLAGSILELLVAVPSHVAVRHKDTCCAPAVSFYGIATGISIMLLAFGPGVFFLFADRFRHLTKARHKK